MKIKKMFEINVKFNKQRKNEMTADGKKERNEIYEKVLYSREETHR